MSFVMEKGIEPGVLAVVSGYLLGEIAELRAQRDRTGRMVVEVRFFDTEAMDWNSQVDASDMTEEEKAQERWQEDFVHFYALSDDGSRVVEIRDHDGNLIERDPLPWAEQEAAYQAGLRPRPERKEGPRRRPSGLASVERALPTPDAHGHESHEGHEGHER